MEAAVAFWREQLWQSADSVGVALDDEQLETIARDLAEASRRAPELD